MADIKSTNLHVEDTSIPEGTHFHHVGEIDQGNNAVLLDIGVDDEKGDAGSLKLAKDRHVSRLNSLDIPTCSILMEF